MCAGINYFDHVAFLYQTHRQARAVHIQGQIIQLMHIRGPTIQTYEGPQGLGTMLLKSGTVPEIRGPLRPMLSTTKACCRMDVGIIKLKIENVYKKC